MTVSVAEQIDGGVPPLCVSMPPQPPVPNAVANHALYSAVSWVCVRQALDAVALVGQVSTTGGTEDTVKVA